MQILDGRKTRLELLPALQAKIKALGKVPTLAIIQCGDLTDSNSFISAKKLFAKKVGVNIRHLQLPEEILQEKLIQVIEECNANSEIQGIIVQLPLAQHLNADLVIESIDPKKDVDALTSTNVKAWMETRSVSNNKRPLQTGTARGIRELLEYYDISISGKKVTVVGSSDLVGKPIAYMCINENAIVTVCNRKTADIAKDTLSADIIISATGQPGLITKDLVSEGQVIVDVGIIRKPDGKITGDVDFESVKDKVKAISPVPGGVGPMTVLGLFENIADLCNNSST